MSNKPTDEFSKDKPVFENTKSQNMFTVTFDTMQNWWRNNFRAKSTPISNEAFENEEQENQMSNLNTTNTTQTRSMDNANQQETESHLPLYKREMEDSRRLSKDVQAILQKPLNDKAILSPKILPNQEEPEPKSPRNV